LKKYTKFQILTFWGLTPQHAQKSEKKFCASQQVLSEDKLQFPEQLPENFPFYAVFHAPPYLAAFHGIHIAQDFGGGVEQ
jgi:hypothetical protein